MKMVPSSFEQNMIDVHLMISHDAPSESKVRCFGIAIEQLTYGVNFFMPSYMEQQPEFI